MLKYPKQVIQLCQEHKIFSILKYLLISKEVFSGNFRNFLLLLIIFYPKNHFTSIVENQKERYNWKMIKDDWNLQKIQVDDSTTRTQDFCIRPLDSPVPCPTAIKNKYKRTYRFLRDIYEINLIGILPLKYNFEDRAKLYSTYC